MRYMTAAPRSTTNRMGASRTLLFFSRSIFTKREIIENDRFVINRVLVKQ